MHEPKKDWKCSERNGVKDRRRGPPPCNVCPKKNPTEAVLYELSPANRRAVLHYNAHEAMHFNAMSDVEKQDPIVQRNFEIIHGVYRELDKAVDRAYENQRMAVLMQAVKPRDKR